MPVRELDRDASWFLCRAWSEGTLRTRNSQWKKFMDFCSANGMLAVPASDRTVVRFLVFLSRTCKFVTINNYLSAVINLQKFHGFQLNYRESYLVKLLLQGLKRELGAAVNQKEVLSLEELRRMYACVDLTNVNEVSMWSALMVLFRSMLRKGNLVAGSGAGVHVLRRCDVDVISGGVMLRVRSSKTLQFKDRVLSVPIFYSKSAIFCAASGLLTHLARRVGDPEDNLFYLVQDGVWRPLLYVELLAFLKKLVGMIGLDESKYGLHSLRRSSATLFHQLGFSLEDVMLMGDWKSLAVLEYLVLPVERKLMIEKYVAGELR